MALTPAVAFIPNRRCARNVMAVAAFGYPAMTIRGDPEHLWVRMGGPVFCGKPGCGIIRSEDTEHTPCTGKETGGIRLLRSLRDTSLVPERRA